MRHLRPAALYPFFFLSGASALGQQMVWIRMFAAGLGHEVPALVAVAGGFLGGMAVGGWCLDRPISRSPRAGRWYGGLELTIGGWAILSAWLVPAVNELALALMGPSPSPPRHWGIVFTLPFLCLLPATAALGATLPAMDRFLSPLSADGRCLGALYAANTLGAVSGTLGTVFGLMPAVGFRACLLWLAAINCFCGAAALVLSRTAGRSATKLWPEEGRAGPSGVDPSHEPSDCGLRIADCGLRNPPRFMAAEQVRKEPGVLPELFPFWRIGLTVFGTGLLGIGFELGAIRVLSQVLENTIYTYAAALAVYLVGTALGAMLYQKFGRMRSFEPTLMYLLGGVAAACLTGTRLLTFTHGLYDECRRTFGDGLAAVLLSEMAAAGMVFGLPTVLMGATFSHLVQGARREAGGVGRAGALNSLGCALATGLVSVVLLPTVGSKWTLTLLSLAYLGLLPRIRSWGWAMLALSVALSLTLPADLQLVDRPAGAHVLAYREGVLASVAVVQTPDGQRSLRVNNRLQMGGTAAAVAERRQAHLPLLLHPNPRRALFLGAGTGITLGAVGEYAGLSADGVELVPEVLDLMRYFEPENGGPLPKPGIALSAADARRFVRTTTNRYDLIVADLFHPGQDGAGFLYTREHFDAVRRCLAARGLFCQWLPLHQVDEPVLRSILRTFLESFPQTHAFLLHFNVDMPVLALLGANDPWRLPPEWLDQRLQDSALRSALRDVGLDKPINLLGCLAAGPRELRRFADEAPISSEDQPLVLFAAPRFTVRRVVRPEQLLLTFLGRSRTDVAEFIRGVLGLHDDAFAASLSDFIAARDIYLKGLVAEGAGSLESAIEAYLESAARSLYFTPAYARCVTIIQVMANSDREQARKLFQRLEKAQPAQPIGRRLLGPLLDDPTGQR